MNDIDVLQVTMKAEESQRVQLDYNNGPTPMIFENEIGWIDDPTGPKVDFGNASLEVVKQKTQHILLTKEPKREMAQFPYRNLTQSQSPSP